MFVAAEQFTHDTKNKIQYKNPFESTVSPQNFFQLKILAFLKTHFPSN